MYRNLLEIPIRTASLYPDRISHKSKSKTKEETHRYGEFVRLIADLAAGFSRFGLKKGDHVGFFVNNRYEWTVTDFALMALGAISVPRGSDTMPKEVRFIFNHSDSTFLILETASQLDALFGEFRAEDWDRCERLYLIEPAEREAIPAILRDRTVFYGDLIAAGREETAREPGLLDRLSNGIGRDDLLTIVYTSGTTGNPKGVMLTQGNFIQNVDANNPRLAIDPEKAEKTVVMLPSWHVYERTFEYCALASAATIVYSSAGRFAADLLSEKPEILISVPRIWESIYQKLIKAMSEMPAPKRHLVFLFIKINQVYLSSLNYLRGCYVSLKRRNRFKRVVAGVYNVARVAGLFPGHILAGLLFKPFREKVGGRLRGATSGAGSLPKYLDELFNSIGINILNAYGMTECAPGILSRTFGRNTFGSTGSPFDNTEIRISREDGTEADIGEKGVLYVRGPQVMMGYYKNPEATRAVLDSEGWLNTGDLAVWSENGEVIIVGRMKDTIVLSGGENVEPEPIEDKMKESAYIDHAVVLGQDQRQLSAIVAVNEDELMKLAEELKLSPLDKSPDGRFSIEDDRIYEVLLSEVNSLISREHGFKPFEYITKILPVRNDFSIGKELTQTLKIRRKYIEERYKGLIARLFSDTAKRQPK
jgi:long-chain acyl-CoA synthetase